MSAAIRDTSTKTMPFAVRPLRESDIFQAKAIEKDSFPTLFPPTSFRRELKNRVAQYWVAERDGSTEKAAKEGAIPAHSGPDERRPGTFEKILGRARSFWRSRSDDGTDSSFLVGFLGTWYVVDEAHIVSVGVRSDHQRRGIGELLLIAAIEHAMAKQTETMTLEVRRSNVAARSLYEKHGFTERGVRKAYYSDNHEDAVIMTTESIQMTPYLERFLALKRAHRERWGRAEIEIGT